MTATILDHSEPENDCIFRVHHSPPPSTTLVGGDPTLQRGREEKEKTNSLMKMKKKVAFNPRARVRIIPTVGSLSQDEVDSYWYSAKELSSILASVKRTIERMELNQGPFDEALECTRGLEKRTRNALELKKKERVALLATVAREYYMQKRYDHADDSEEVLAAMYRLRCAEDQESARLMGMVDEEEALRIFLHDAAQVFLAQKDDEYEEDECFDHWAYGSGGSAPFNADSRAGDGGKRLSMILEESWAERSATGPLLLRS